MGSARKDAGQPFARGVVIPLLREWAKLDRGFEFDIRWAGASGLDAELQVGGEVSAEAPVEGVPVKAGVGARWDRDRERDQDGWYRIASPGMLAHEALTTEAARGREETGVEPRGRQ